jgi:single-stranded DNA-binding protein
MNTVTASGTVTWLGKKQPSKNSGSWMDFGMAVDKPEKASAVFLTVRCYDKLADVVGDVLAKRMRIVVSGGLRHASWEKNGVKQEKVYVAAQSVMRLRKFSNEDGETPGDGSEVQAPADAQPAAATATPDAAAVDEETMPF